MKVIPNENSWIGFRPTTVSGGVTTPGVVVLASPSLATEISAAVDLTGFLISITANTTGNTVPTPTLKTLFETSIAGTAGAQFTADFYRDDEADLAWSTLPRGVRGMFLISRFGGTGPGKAPALTQKVEVWPVRVTSRSASALTSNTAETFTVTCSVPVEPVEDATVAA